MASLDPNNNNSSSSHQGPFHNSVDHPSLASPNPASCFPVPEFDAAHQLGVQRPWANSTAHIEKPIKISPNPSFVYADGSRLLPAFASMDAYGNSSRTFIDSPELGGMNWDGKLPYMFPASHSSSNLLVGNPLGHAMLHDGSSLREVAAMRPAVSNDKGAVASGVGSFLVGSSPPLSDMEKLLNSSWGSLNSSVAPVDPSEGGLPLQAMNLPSSACVANFSTDPGFAERAAKFSSFNNHGYPELAQSSVSDGGRAVNRLVVASQAKLTRVSSGHNTPRCSAPSSPVACAGATEASNGMPEMIHRHSAHVQEASGAVLLEDAKVNFEKKISCSPSQVDGGDGVQKRCISVNESDESMGQEVSSSCERNGGSCEIASQGMNGNSGQKRRAISKDRSSKPVAAAATATVKDSENDEGKSKRSKSGDGANGEGSKPKIEQSQSANSDDSTPKSVKENSKPPEAPKPDYIHVRARRGQATDSHSLAERVRREKISERMKFLQDLVPGCSKVTGKAVMLDEIINYVQSLQRQVEFLSMKLAAVNPRLDFNIESLFAREMMQPRASSQTLVFAPENTNSNTNSYPPAHQQQSQALLQVGGSCAPMDVHSLASDPTVRPINNPLTSMDAYGDSVSQVSQAWDNELQSIVQMGFAQGRQTPLSSPNVQGQLYPGQMKVEL